MEKKIKIISFILILTILINVFMSLFLINEVFAVTQTTSTDIEQIDESKYPGIKNKIEQLKVEHPNWNFKILYTGLDWAEVIANEYVGHGLSPRNLIYKSTSYQGQWICSICGDKIYDNGNWKCASEQAVRYLMDPRNSLNSSYIFQFEELSNIGCDVETLSTMTKGTFLEGHEEGIVEVSNNNNINAYYIVARLIQEQGKSGTVLTKGQGYNGNYVGLYNAFNIAASGNSTAEILNNALAYAKKKEWTTLEKSIEGGISFLANNYIHKGQNTLYLQKFDVEATNGLYANQYMQNILAAQSESITLKNMYSNVNSIESSHTFIIPVYENMPQGDSPLPNSDIPNTTSEDLVRINVDGSLRIRNAPNGDTTVGYLYLNEIVARLEKATTKINGTYWDKIKKSDGTEGYSARETYENESNYKLYLVPINVENSTNTSNNNENNNSNSQNETNTIATESNENSNNENNTISGELIANSGDVDGDGKINAMDMYKVIQYILGNLEFSQEQISATDLNNDNKIDAMDMYLLIQKIKNS